MTDASFPFLMLLLLTAAGGGFTFALARVIRAGRAVTAILLVSYVLRVALAVALYVISAWHLPVLSSLHLEDGFWRFSPDAQSYHYLGIAIVDSLRWGTELPDFRFFGDSSFPVIVGLLYRAIGAHPLDVPLLNAALCSGILGLTYWLARRLNGERAGIVAVALVAMWPSLYLWSAQALKDVLALVLTLALLAMMTVAIEQRLRFAATAALWAALIPSALLLVFLRSYVVVFVIAGLCAVVARRLVAPTNGSRRDIVRFGAAYAAVLVACLIVGGGLDLAYLVSPAQRQAREGHFRKAQYLEMQGDTTGAIVEYARVNGHIQPPLPAAAVEEILRPRFPDGTQTTLSRLSLEEAKGPAPPPKPVIPKFISQRRPPPPLTLGQIVEQVVGWVPARIALRQIGYLRTNTGGMLPDASATGLQPVSDLSDVLLRLPQATATALWAPFPWQWFRTDGGTGVFRQVSAIETMLLALLTPWLVLGVWRGLRTRMDGAWLLIGYLVPAAIVVGLVVLNLGSLFRLRLQFLIPLLIIAAAYGASNSKLVTKLVSSLSTRPIEPVPSARTASVPTSVKQEAS